MPKKAIVFDLDDTLLADYFEARKAFLKAGKLAEDKHGVAAERVRDCIRATSRVLWYTSPYREFFVQVGMGSWEGLWMEIRTVQEETAAIKEWLPEFQRVAWEGCLTALDINDVQLAAAMADRYKEIKRSEFDVYEDSVPTLEALGKGYRLAMLTNGQVDLQGDKIEMTSLGGYFESITISGEINIGKPDSRIFDLVHERLGLTPGETVMVGNSLHSDIGGANGVGMTSIWLNRDGSPNESEIKPDYEIRGLGELAEILPKL